MFCSPSPCHPACALDLVLLGKPNEVLLNEFGVRTLVTPAGRKAKPGKKKNSKKGKATGNGGGVEPVALGPRGTVVQVKILSVDLQVLGQQR